MENKFEVGQRVIISGNGYEIVSKINRITPSGQVVVGSWRFNKEGRSIPYEVWNPVWIKPCTDEDYERIEKDTFIRSVRGKMSNTDWKSVITDYETAVKFKEFMGL